LSLIKSGSLSNMQDFYLYCLTNKVGRLILELPVGTLRQ
jgi:hypothetical protein